MAKLCLLSGGNIIFEGTKIGSSWAKNILDITVDCALQKPVLLKEIYSISVIPKFHGGDDGLLRGGKCLNGLLRG